MPRATRATSPATTPAIIATKVVLCALLLDPLEGEEEAGDVCVAGMLVVEELP